MGSEVSFAAPWSAGLAALTIAVAILLVGLYALSHHRRWPRRLPPLLLRLLIFAILLAGAGSTILEYELTDARLRVRRPLHTRSIALEDVTSVRTGSDAMAGALRVFGIGGFFSYSGAYRSAQLGRFEAHVSDPSRAVVLGTRSHGVVVVSPADPERFVAVLQSRLVLPPRGD